MNPQDNVAKEEWEKEFVNLVNASMSYPALLDGKGILTLEGFEKVKAFIHKTRQEAYEQGYNEGFQEGSANWKIDEVKKQAIAGERKKILREALKELPRTFWEDEDHAVGGYISKKDLYSLLTPESK